MENEFNDIEVMEFIIKTNTRIYL